jgi:hypothetical protein
MDPIKTSFSRAQRRSLEPGSSWRRRSVWKLVKKCNGNCWIAANYTWSETNCRKSKPRKGPPNPLKSVCLPRKRLLKAKVAAQPRQVALDLPVSENLSPRSAWVYEILGLNRPFVPMFPNLFISFSI